ncbi:MAG: hypothetical protein JW839_13435, partial [Candidatus Lokiarchaeota archaeon]|nr:hypothetical protein [Candidatus Lokiarchaeota archaeon]
MSWRDILLSHERRIVQYFVRSGLSRGMTEKLSTLVGFLLTRSKLTQSQLRRLTGYSMGTISTHLNRLASLHFVTRVAQPGTNERLYAVAVFPFDASGPVQQWFSTYIGGLERLLAEGRAVLGAVEAAGHAGGSPGLEGRLRDLRRFLDGYER